MRVSCLMSHVPMPAFDNRPRGSMLCLPTMELRIRFCTTSDGVSIAYATVGQGPPLVVVNAWGSSLELFWKNPAFRAYLEGLAQSHLLIGFDRRGVGASQREVDDLALEAQVLDVAAVADQLQLEPFDLYGEFDGAAVSVAYAAQHADRVSRLVLLAPYSHGEDIGGPQSARTLIELIRGNWSLARRALADIVFPKGPTELQVWFSNLLRESMSPEVAAKYIEFQTNVDIRPLLPQVKAPTLVLHRRRDRRAPVSSGRAAAALIPNASLVVLEVVSGGSGLEDWQTALTAIEEFLGDGGVEVAAGAEPTTVGTVYTILFTDIEGSTALTQRLGDAKARELLREHERMVREALKAHGGSEVKTMGDGFMASFSSATKALECAIAMQRAFTEKNEDAEEPIRVRIGLNAGEPIAEDEDLFGTAVNVAARICAHAGPGQILAPIVVRELAAGKPFLFADLGETELRGFEDPVRLYEVRWRADPTGAQA